MNISYERCSYCNRRKWLTSGCLRKWIKPNSMECKHLQRSIDKNKDTNIDIVDAILMPEPNSSLNTNKFVKLWKSKFFITTSVRSLQRYFGKSRGADSICKLNKSNDPTSAFETRYGIGIEIKHTLRPIMKCQHSKEGHSVLRSHHQHASLESCAIYCQLYNHGWYWGGITSSEAEELLAGQHDNVFLVRDSYDSRHILCISFRCVGRTLHARLLHANGLFSLDNETFVPAYRLSEHCSAVNVKTNLFEMPVKLARPLNRFAKLDSLQKICRFVIRQTGSSNTWAKLPLPPNLISYISMGSDYIIP